MKVTKRNGRTEDFNEEKIKRCAERACDGVSTDVDPAAVVFNARIKLYDGVPTSEIDQALIRSARSLIEQEPMYRFVAAGLLRATIYKEVFGENADSDAFELQYKKTFILNIKELIKSKIASKELAKFDLKYLSSCLKIDRDRNFAYLGLQTLYDRYLMHIDDKKMETPQGFWMRVAMGLAIKEAPEDKEKYAARFYNLLSNFEFMSSTPTLFNSGGTFNQLSSCYLNTFEDSINGIFDGVHQEALKNKYAGGLGMDITSFRATNSYITGTNGSTQGAVYFWKLYGDMLAAVNQGGKRRGAGCAYLECWHADFDDFLALRKNTGDERKRTHDMNTASWIPDLFMKRIQEDGEWHLFSPDETPELHELFGAEFVKKYEEYTKLGKKGKLRTFRTVNAKELWKKMLRSLFETGHPWVTFKDPSNVRYSNQHEGTVHSSNLCTEILLHTKPTRYKNEASRTVKEYGETAVCNLGSINLQKHLIKVLNQDTGKPQWEIDYKKMKKTITTAMRMLDNVIDINFYPTEEARRSNTRHRPVGLGSMGWHDMYYNLDVKFDSDEAVALSDKLYEFISYHSILASSRLAKERGQYGSYDGSLWSQGVFPIDTYSKLMKSRGASGYTTKETYCDGEACWDYLRNQVKKFGMRNSNTMAIAPTATISSIVGCSPSIEPRYSVLYVYSTLSGEFTMVNEYFVEALKNLELWNHDMLNKIKQHDGDLTMIPEIPDDLKEQFKTAFQQDQFKMIEAAAARQKWIDMGQSLNLYNSETSLRYMNDLYTQAWESGLKTTYYLRNKAASKIEKSTVSTGEPKACSITDPSCESCQ
jgi:ribonucleoside-diphosphate reductase alpha chain